MEDEGLFDMSTSAVSERDLCGESCVVNEWLSHDDDDQNSADDIVNVMSASQPSFNKSSLLQTARLTVAVTESPVKQEILNTVPYCHTVPMSLDFTSLVVDLVHQYAAQVCRYVCLYCLKTRAAQVICRLIAKKI